MTILTELRIQMKVLGIPEDQFRVETALVHADRPATDSQTLYVRYRSLFASHSYIADDVKIEVSARSLILPFVQRPILSLLTEYSLNEAYAERPLEIPVVGSRKTFLEKTVGTTGLASGDPNALLLTQEDPTRLRRVCFVFSFAPENKFPFALEKTKPAATAAGSLFVGTTGFEPATPCTPCKCATGLRYVPKNPFHQDPNRLAKKGIRPPFGRAAKIRQFPQLPKQKAFNFFLRVNK
jgi:hypothetical protein